jgi:hypothetical protein
MDRQTANEELTKRMLQTNRMRFLIDDLQTALLNYRTPQLDDKTSKKILNYIRYLEGMREEMRIEFCDLTKEVLNIMDGRSKSSE